MQYSKEELLQNLIENWKAERNILLKKLTFISKK